MTEAEENVEYQKYESEVEMVICYLSGHKSLPFRNWNFASNTYGFRSVRIAYSVRDYIHFHSAEVMTLSNKYIMRNKYIMHIYYLQSILF